MLLGVNIRIARHGTNEAKFNLQKLSMDGNVTTNKVPLVAWDLSCKSKRKRGLGILNATIWNETVIAKFTWNISQKADDLYDKWIHHL